MPRASLFIHLVRTLLRFWGLSLLNVVGLAIGFAATIIIGLFIWDELTFDRFLPNAERTYLLAADYGTGARPLVASDKTPAGMAAWLRKDVGEVQSIGRLHPMEWPVKSDRYANYEPFFWADPNIFELLELKAVSGDLRTALSQPDAAVLTQNMARKYFGRDDVVGQSLTINTYLHVRITAVLADYPPNSTLNREMFVTSHTGYSMLTILDNNPSWQWASVYTFVRLKPGAEVKPDLLKSAAAHNWMSPHNLPAKFRLIPLTDLHFSPDADGRMKERGHLDSLLAMAGVACLILILATVNFSGLLLAQIDERQEEMAIRRTLGGRPHHLGFQVIGEATVISALAGIAAIMLTERVLPIINSRMALQLDLWRAPTFTLILCAAVVVIGGLASIAPAMVVWRAPATRIPSAAYSYLSRRAWIAIQLALLITLLIGSHTVFRQWSFATSKALNFDGSQVLLVPVNQGIAKPLEFKDDILAVPGVEAATLSRYIPILEGMWPAFTKNPSGENVQFTLHSVDPQFFEVYRVRILAGRIFSRISETETQPEEIVINQSAAARFGYLSPQDAIGRKLVYQVNNHIQTSKIIGVVDDMRIATVREPIRPMIFDNQSRFFTHLSVRVRDRNDMRTFHEIRRQWQRENGNNATLKPYFVSDYLADQYRDIKQQWWAFGLLSVVGTCISVLGLSGLSIYLARARLREIAIRNALGARLVDIMRLRLEPLVRPLLLANLIGYVAAWLLMSWWLSSFKAHVALSPLSFALAGSVTVLIAVGTVATHILISSPIRSSHPLRAD